MPVPNMKAKPPRPNEEPYAGKLLVRFREGLGRRLPSLLDKRSILILLCASFSLSSELLISRRMKLHCFVDHS